MNKRLIYFGALSICVFLVFHLKFGLEIINPQNYKWLYKIGSDMLPDITTWEYYRHSPYFDHAPGIFSGYAYPQVTGVGNTNIVPFLSMPLHWINVILPEHFQHFGIFLFLCYALQVIFADRLLAILGMPIGWLRFFAVVSTLIAAPFLDRFNHLALCAHWIILASLCFYFRSYTNIKRDLGHFLLLSALSALTHPYLILFPLAIAFATGLHKFRFTWRSIFYPFAGIVGVLLAFAVSGVFSLAGGAISSGFGIYSANLNTFWNNIGKTNFSALNLDYFYTEQYEGYAYLGIGILLIYVLVAGFTTRLLKTIKIFTREHWPLLVTTIILWYFALGFNFTWGNFMVLDVNLKSGTFVYKLASIFRSSGRYIWLLYYLLLLFPFVFLHRQSIVRQKFIIPFVFCAMVLQFLDMSKAIKRSVFENNYRAPEKWSLLKDLASNASKVYTFPAFERTLVDPDDMQYLVGFLGRKQIPITAGHLPRTDQKAQNALNQKMDTLINSGKWNLEDGGLIITRQNELYNFGNLAADSHIKIYAAGDYRFIFNYRNKLLNATASQHNLVIDAASATSLKDYLQKHSTQTLLIITVDEAANKLDSSTRLEMAKFSERLSKIRIGESYVGIISNRIILSEQIQPAGQHASLVFTKPSSDIRIEMKATSGTQNKAMLIINGNSVTDLDRGINFFIINEKGLIQERKRFDTYRTIYAQD